jgi:predicted nucleic-acid-binding protein
MKLFVDTNVILDWILAREHAFGWETRQIIQQTEQGETWIMVLFTLVYVLEKSGLKTRSREIPSDWFQFYLIPTKLWECLSRLV